MHRIAYLYSIVVLAITLLFAGCAGLGKKLEPPRINVTNIQLQEVKALESVFEIDLRVFNANDIPIVIKGIDCELLINGKRFASGLSNKETKIPSYGTEIVRMIVYSSILDIFKGVIGLSKEEKLKYQIKGKVHLDAGPLTPSTLPFWSKGDLDLEKIVK